MTKITSINQTGGIIAEKVNTYDWSIEMGNIPDGEIIINGKKFVPKDSMVATLKKEGYIVYSPDQWKEIESWILNSRKQYKDYPISEMILNEVEIVLEVK